MNLRTVFIFILLLASASIAAAQEASPPCVLRPELVAQAAELKGFRTGLTIEQVKQIVPSLELGPTDEFGLSKTSFSPDFNPKINKAAFAGVRTVSLDFLDGRVAALWIGYNETFKWKTVDEFVRGLTTALGLPSAWESRSRSQQMTCGDLEITISMVGGSPTLRLADEAARAIWEQRRTEKEETGEP